MTTNIAQKSVELNNAITQSSTVLQPSIKPKTCYSSKTILNEK